MPPAPTTTEVAVRGTTLHAEVRGGGPTVLLIHGAGEDSSMHGPQAEALAAAGFQVVTYDRRGTGRSGREAWPAPDAADQHADDAAALLEALHLDPATVLGLSSGGVVALALAARRPEVVERAIAWEPPALGLVPGAEELHAELTAPVRAHLEAHPDDLVGAQALFLTMILGFPVSADDPAFAAARANAEPMLRDDPNITMRRFTAADLAAAPVTVAIGSTPNEAVRAGVAALAELTGVAPVVVEGASHEVYLADPGRLAALVADLVPVR